MKTKSTDVPARTLSPADSPIGSPESWAAARALLEQKNDPFQARLVPFSLTGLSMSDAVLGHRWPVPPDFDVHYEMKDGSIVQIWVSHHTGRALAYLFQAWPDGRPYDVHKEKCFPRNLADFKAMVERGEARKIDFRGFPGHEYID